MSKPNQNLKQRLIQGLTQIPELWMLTTLLDNISHWQQEVKVQMAAEVGGKV